MAYLNEFPSLKPNELNLNWLLEQYATFNERIQQILNHFDETVAEIRQDLATFENDINTQFGEFKTEVRNDIATLEDNVTNEINTFEETVNGEVDTIRDVIEIVNENTEQYINENIQSFLWNVVTVTLEKSANVSPEGNATINFDSYTIPEGYASFVILEYSEQYQNIVWIGGNINPSSTVGVFPSLRYTKSSDNYNFTMNVYNPISEGALDVTARIKLLLIPDTSMIGE